MAATEYLTTPARVRTPRSAWAAAPANLTGLGLGYAYLRRPLRVVAAVVGTLVLLVIAFVTDASNAPWLWRVVAAGWLGGQAVDGARIARSGPRPPRGTALLPIYVDERLATIALRRVDTAVTTLSAQTGAARAATVGTSIRGASRTPRPRPGCRRRCRRCGPLPSARSPKRSSARCCRRWTTRSRCPPLPKLDTCPSPGGKPMQAVRLAGGLYLVLLRPTGSRGTNVRTLTAVDGAGFCVYAVPAGPSV